MSAKINHEIQKLLFEFDLEVIAKIVDLRQRVLYPSGTIDKVIYSLDTHKNSVHFIAREEVAIGSCDSRISRNILSSNLLNGTRLNLIATGSLLAEDEEEKNSLKHWRIRGMAVDPSWQGKGLGHKIVNSMIDHAKNQSDAKLIWCNAREEALTLYQRLGFAVESDKFIIPGSGPHFRLKLKL